MADGAQTNPSIDKSEHVDENVSAKRVANYIWDGSNWARQTASAGGGGTEYTNGDVAPANPIGGIPTFDDGGTIRAVSAAHPLPTTATITGGGDASAAKQDTGNASLASIDGKITAVNTGAVTVASSALPTGAATAAKQPALGTAGTASADVISVQGIASMTALKVDGSAVTQPVSGTVTSNLGTLNGAATSAKQDTGNTSLSSIDGKLTDVATQTTLAQIKAKTDNIPAQGQALAAASVPVVLTAAQEVALTPPAAITGFSTSTKQSDGSQKTQVVDGAGNVIGATSNALDVNIKSGSASGTEYTEDAAAAANPTGPILNLIREDARAGNLTSTDGDNVAARGNNKGELYVKTTDSDALLTTIDADTSNIATSVANIDTDTTTMIGHLDGVEGLLTTIDGDTGNISTKIDTVAGAVSGTEMQVDVVGALPAGTNNIGDVDVVSSALPTGAATSAKQDTAQTALDAIKTATELADDTVATLGTTTYTEAATKGNVIGAVRRDADTTLVDTTNEVAPLQVDARGALKVEAFSGETLPVSLTSTTVTGTVAVTQSGTWDEVGINDSGNSITVDNGGTFAVQVDGNALTSLQLIDDGIATAGSAITTKGMAAVGTDGTNARILKTDTSGELQVDVVGALPAGTNAIGKLAANSGVDIGDVDVTSVVPGTGASNLGKAEDSGHTTGDVGVMTLGVRTDAQAALAGTTADYIPMTTDSVGAQYVTLSASTGAIGASMYWNSGLTSTKQAVNASGGNLYGYHFYNPNSTVAYVQFFNVASASVTVGTTAPNMVVAIPPGGWADSPTTGPGIGFATAMTVAATTTSTGSGNPSSAIMTNIWYK